MTTTYTVSGVDLTTVSCGQCGMTYAIPEKFRLQKQQEGGTWHCPGCDVSWGYSGRGENETLRRQIVAKDAQLDQLRADRCYQVERVNAANRRISAAHGQMTKLKKRISAGVCPCCKRSFKDLARHMNGKHPDFNGDSK